MRLKFYDCGIRSCRPFDPCPTCAKILDIQDEYARELCNLRPKEYLRSKYWQAVKQWVGELYINGCANVDCLQKDNRHNIHHLNYSCRGNESLYDLVRVCQTCHQNIHKKDRAVSSSDYQIDADPSSYSPIAKWAERRDFELDYLRTSPGAHSIGTNFPTYADGNYFQNQHRVLFDSQHTGTKRTRDQSFSISYITDAQPVGIFEDRLNNNQYRVKFHYAPGQYAVVTAYQENVESLRSQVDLYTGRKQAQDNINVGLHSFNIAGIAMNNSGCESRPDEISLRFVDLEIRWEDGSCQQLNLAPHMKQIDDKSHL